MDANMAAMIQRKTKRNTYLSSSITTDLLHLSK